MIQIFQNGDSHPACVSCDRESQKVQSKTLGRPIQFWDLRLQPNENYAQVITMCEVCLKQLVMIALSSLGER